MSDYNSYQHIPDTAARDAHEAHVLRQSERTQIADHSDNASFSSHQTQPAEARPKIDWSNGEKLSYQHHRNYSEKGEPEIEGSVVNKGAMRATTRTQQDPMTGVETKTTEVSLPFGESLDTGEAPPGTPIDLSSIDTGRLADKIADEGGLAIRDLSDVLSTGIQEGFAEGVADLIIGRETRAPVEIPQQFVSFVDEFNASGSISEDSLVALEGMGISRQLIHRMIRGRAKLDSNKNATVIHHPNAISNSLERAAQQQRHR